MFSIMLRKQVVSLTSAILMVALITNIAGLIKDAEADRVRVVKQNVTHSCVDTDHPSQSNICQTVQFSVKIIINPHGHKEKIEERDVFISTGVTSCSQCPNPPFTNYN